MGLLRDPRAGAPCKRKEIPPSLRAGAVFFRDYDVIIPRGLLRDPRGGAPCKRMKSNASKLRFEVFLNLQGLDCKQACVNTPVNLKTRAEPGRCFSFFCGGRGIRTPGSVYQNNGFQDRRIRPLCHSSVARKSTFFFTFYPFFQLKCFFALLLLKNNFNNFTDFRADTNVQTDLNLNIFYICCIYVTYVFSIKLIVYIFV